MENPFDKFDASSGNPFDKFDEQSSAKAKSLAWSDVPGQAVKNLLPSAGSFLGGIGQAIAHPIDTAGTLLGAATGGLDKLIRATGGDPNRIGQPGPGNQTPERMAEYAKLIEQNRRDEQAANAIGQFAKERYGSTEGFKKTLATDPIGAAADLSAVLGGGAGLARLGGTGARAAALRGVPGAGTASALLTGGGEALQAAGRAINPITPIIKATPALGTAAANIIGGLGTHTGAETIKQAFQSGRAGGASAQELAANMRGNVPMTDVLDAAKANLEQMGRDKSAAYRQGMAQVSGDKTVLDFSGIDQAVSDAAKVATFKGQVKNTKAAQVQQSIADAVDEWKALNPAEYHTPEGLDALKQRIGGIVESIPYEERTAGLVGKKIYNAVKDEIVKQAPVYADTMKGYSEASDQIREIERALSLGSKASVDTAMRKLQSLTRNNVNTNYGNRLNLARQLEQQGGQQLMPALAGQALSSWTPRGLGGATAGLLGLGAGAAGGVGAAIPALAVQSPRLMGEAALLTGRGAGLADRVPFNRNLANYLYQAGRLPEQ